MIPKWIRNRTLEGLDPSETGLILKRARLGDEAARERIVLAHSRLVAKIVMEVNGARQNEDLFQEGIVGLFHAVDRYKTGYRTKFSTYATYWIRYYVQRGMAGTTWDVRVPLRRLREAGRIRAAEERLAQRLGRIPSDGEVATSMGWRAARLERVRRETFVSVEEKSMESSQCTIPSPLETYLERETAERIKSAIGRLSPSARDVLTLRYGLLGSPPETLSDVGEKMGISAEAVRQTERRALRRLKETWELIDRRPAV